jgi:hypothetical protein
MDQAKRVHSTPPTSTSLSRRAVIVAGVALLPVALAIATAAPAAAARLAGPDPIFVAIEKHDAATIVWDATVDVWAKFPDGPEPMPIERQIERERINDAWRAAPG